MFFFSVFLSFARRSDTRRIVDEYNNILLWGRIVCVRCAGNDDYDDDDMLSHNANPFRCSCCRFTNIYIVTESFRVAFFRFCFFFSFVFVIISYSCSCSSSSSSYSKWRAPFPLYIHQNVVTLFISSSLVHFGERSFIDVRCHFHQRGDDDEKKKRETNQKRLVPRNLIRNDTLRFLIHCSVHVIFHFFFFFLFCGMKKAEKCVNVNPMKSTFNEKTPHRHIFHARKPRTRTHLRLSVRRQQFEICLTLCIRYIVCFVHRRLEKRFIKWQMCSSLDAFGVGCLFFRRIKSYSRHCFIGRIVCV